MAQGGDWGAVITQQLALLAPAQVLGIHSNMPGTVPADILAAAHSGSSAPAGLSGDELHAFEQLKDFYAKHLGYAIEMAKSPADALRIDGLPDRPRGVDSRSRQGQLRVIAPAFHGNPGGLTRDDVLDNITMYWLTKTANLVGASLLGK